MKLAILFALVAAAAVSAYIPSTYPGTVFKPGEEYIYHYKGQVLSGIPKSNKQYGGLLIDSLVVLQFQQDFKVVMKLKEIKLFKINQIIPSLPSELLHESQLTRLTGEQAQVITEHLVKPIKFRYEEGEVRELEKETSDRFWSVNIKKGILSLYQVTLKEKNSFSSSSDSSLNVDPFMSRMKTYGPRSHTPMNPYWKLSSKTNSVFKVMETDVTGNCETKYTVISDKEHVSTSTSTLRVSSVRNFDNCINKPFLIQGLFQGVHRYPTEKDLIQPTVHTDYLITGDRTHFLIKEATSRGKYFFFVNGLEGGSMSTFTVQRLTLKTTEPIRTPIRIQTPKMDVQGLQMIIPRANLLPGKRTYEDLMTERSSVYRRTPSEYPSSSQQRSEYLKELEEEEEEGTYGRETGDIVSVVDMKLDEMIDCLYSGKDKICSVTLLEVSRILRDLTKEQLFAIINRYVKHETSSEVEYRKSEILLDILPTLPQPEVSTVLIELIRERKISELRGSVLIEAMSLLIKPTPLVIKNSLELYKELPKERSTTLGPKTLLRQALLLSVGTITHRLIINMRSHSKPVPEIITFIDTISTELKRMFEETSSESEKTLIMKSIGNMGASETILFQKTIIEDPRLPLELRITTLRALRRTAKLHQKHVIPIVLSTFMDTKEPVELRIPAMLLILNSNPSLTTLQLMGHSTRHEPSSQIRTLFYSKIMNLAKYTSHEPEHKTLIKNCRLVSKIIPPVPVGFYDSYSLFLNKYSEKYDLGLEGELVKIKSKSSGMAEVLIGKLQGTLFGKHRSLLEVKGEGKALIKILRKLFGPYGLFRSILKGEVSLNDFLKPLTRIEMGGVEHKIRDILNKMMLETTMTEEIKTKLMMKVLDSELQYIQLNPQNFEEVINKVTNMLPELLVKLSRGVKIDILKSLSHVASVTIPTPLGLPLSLNFTTMGVVKILGHAKVNNMPSWSEMMTPSRFMTSLPKISLELDVKPRIDVSQFVSFGVNMRWLGSGVCTEAHVVVKKPVKVLVNLDGPDHSATVIYFPVKEPIRVLHATVLPTTYIKYIPTTVNKLPYHFEKKEINSVEIVKPYPFEHRYHCSITGLEAEVRGMVSLCGPTWCPVLTSIISKQEISITTRPITEVQQVKLHIKSLKTNINWEGVPASHSTEELFTDNEEEYESEFFNSEIPSRIPSHLRTPSDMEDYPEMTRTLHKQVNPRFLRSSMMIESGEFEPIITDSIFKSEPIKRQILITLGPSNKQSPKIKSLITWLMSTGENRYLKNQINVQVVRLAHRETPTWKIVVNNVFNPLTWNPEEVRYGREIGTEFLNKLNVKLNVFGITQELKCKIVPGSPFDFSQELREHSILPVDDLPIANAQKYKYTVQIEFPRMNHKILKYITISHDFIKYLAYYKLTTGIPTTPQPNIITLSAEFLPWWEKVNVIVKTPRENSYISGIPFYWNPFLPTSQRINMHDIPSWKWYSNSSNDNYMFDTVPYTTTPILGESRECIYSERSKTIKTFDGISLPVVGFERYLKKSCEFVLTQHCTSDGLFSVVVSGDVDSWKLKCLVPNYELKVKVINEQEIKVTVNEEEKTLHVSKPIIIRQEYSESSPVLYKIEKIDSRTVLVHAKELGISLIVDTVSKTIAVKMSLYSMLQGQLCGLCGNYNQDPSDDYYNTQSDFQTGNRDFMRVIKNSLVPSDSCGYEHIKPINDEYCMEESHVTIPRQDKEIPMTCRTERKVPQCAPGCRAERYENIKTCFTCSSESGITLPRKTYSPSRWDMEEETTGGVECEDYFQRVEIPTRCVPTY